MPSPRWLALLRPGPLPASGRKSVDRGLSTALHNSLEPLEDGDPEELRGKADLILALATVDPALADQHVSQWGPSAVAVVTSGRSTATGLRSAAHVIQASGLELQSVLLVGTDPGDDTIGAPDGSPPGPWPEAVARPTKP